MRDDIYEKIRGGRLLMSHQELKDTMEDIKDYGLARKEGDDRYASQIRFREHTVELSYQLREKVIEKYPNSHLGDEKFDRYYEQLFRGLPQIELEAMIFSHERGMHRRRANTIQVIRDALMNKILMEGDMNNTLPRGKSSKELFDCIVKNNFTISELERIAIEAELSKTKGNLAAAAKNLGIGRATMYRKVKEYGISR